jgi:hypothetical protein
MTEVYDTSEIEIIRVKDKKWKQKK